jgi:hypothetical protein
VRLAIQKNSSRGRSDLRTRTYLGTDFEVWRSDQSWFWFVPDRGFARGAIGAAAYELDAVREACAAIDEMHAERDAVTRSRPAGDSAEIDWAMLLARLERYLAGIAPTAR